MRPDFQSSKKILHKVCLAAVVEKTTLKPQTSSTFRATVLSFLGTLTWLPRKAADQKATAVEQPLQCGRALIRLQLSADSRQFANERWQTREVHFFLIGKPIVFVDMAI